MATSYAAFTSVMHLITQLNEHPSPPIELDEEQVHSITSNISFFQRFLESHHNTIDHALEIRMADAAHAAEDLIETHAADPIRKRKDFNGSFQPKRTPTPLESSRPPSAASCENNAVCLEGTTTKIPDEHFQRMIEGLDLLRKEVMEMSQNDQSQQDNIQPPPPPSQSATSGEKVVVGVQGIEIQIMDKLTSQHKSDRKTISITGMGGIGKTTLARKVYDNQYIKDYFDICTWATISKDYNIHESLVELLHCLDSKESKHDLRRRSEHELCDKLHKSLFDRRYLVVLDDVWDAEPWYRLKSFFPSSKGSGIVITTRESAFDSISSLTFRMDLLDEHKSRDLLCKTVFGKDSCPPELENTGKSIAKKCKGLPLSIVVIGGHLARSERKTKEYWEYVERDLTSIVSSEDDEHCHKILSLSYAHLPVHLKPCFLYMAAFPEDDEIAVSELIKLWVSEGFLRPIDGQSLEEVARGYLNDLVNRNLILPFKSSRRGKIKTCKIHDLLRDLCVKEASKRNFLRIHGYHDSSEVLSNARRVVVLFNSYLHHLPSLRTLIYDGSMLSSLACKLLRVLYSAENCRYLCHNFITEAAREQVNLRHLKIPKLYDREFTIPPSISSLWNLQSLFIGTSGHFKAPSEILEMLPLLRRIRIKRFYIPDAPPRESSYILENLQSVENIENWSFTEDFVARVPNIKKLKVTYDTRVGEFSDAASLYLHAISRLEKLESFKCSFKDGSRFFGYGAIHKRTVAVFPGSLKKLSCTRIRWDDVTTMIGSLPLLEVLILRECSGSEWVPVEGQRFVRLKHLDISRCRLKSLEADADRFPCLEKLVLKLMFRLEEISSDIGDIPTLRSIEMDACPDSAVRCVKEIAEYQYDLASELQVTVQLGSLSELSPESLSTCNFRVQTYY